MIQCGVRSAPLPADGRRTCGQGLRAAPAKIQQSAGPTGENVTRIWAP